jgi:uncharacterized protein YbjT (DUF2867 family)
MRIAVVGGTGLTGRYTVRALSEAGHEPVVVARSTGVDVVTGAGLERALAGVDAVIDVISLPATDRVRARAPFSAATRHLLAAESAAGVRHHVLLSIIGLDRPGSTPHYVGKRAQEALVEAGPIPYSIQRAAQLHEFAGRVVKWRREGGVARLPPLLLQPVAAADVGRRLAHLAAGPPRGRAVDFAGPGPEDLIDMARRTLAARGETVRLVPTWHSGFFGLDAAGDAMLPGPEADRAPTTFDEWLQTVGRT